MMQKILCKLRHVMVSTESMNSNIDVLNTEIVKMDHAIQRLDQSKSICLFKTDYLE